MSKFCCNICSVNFTTKRCYEIHFTTKKHIKRANNEMNEKFKCECGKSYQFKQGLYAHKKTCTFIPPPPAPTIEKQVEELKTCIEEERRKHEEERDELRGQIVMLLEKFAEQSGSTVNNTTNNIENQNIENMTININAFGNENLDYLTDQVIIKCVGRIYNSIPVLIEKIHFNPKHPENHNIKITNRKLPYASVMTKSKKWKIMDKNDAIETMMDKSFNMLEMSYEENKDEMSEFNKERFEEFQNKFTQQDKETMKTTKKKVELAILNGSS